MTGDTREMAAPDALFQRARTTGADQRVFLAKLGLAAALAAAGFLLALQGNIVLATAGVILLGAVYTHSVELQHQCLHHSAFTSPKPHRPVGVVLGLPLLVSYSHYRVRHLQHHRYLGTPRDSEFFGFDTRRPVTLGLLGKGLFDYRRLVTVLREVYRSCRGTWTYDLGQIAERKRREVMSEYRLIGALLGAAAVFCALGNGELLLRLWLAPLVFAVPMHFLVELPEHVLCDSASDDVLRNTRSITGSRLTTWFTNGNNLHIEHHAAMTVPLSRLRARHSEVQRRAVYLHRSYAGFFWQVLAEACQRPGRGNTEGEPGSV